MIDARGEFPLTRVAAVKELYMRRYGWSEADVITNILEPYKCEATTNYSKVDPKSIMMWVFDLFCSIQELILQVSYASRDEQGESRYTAK